MLNKFRNHSKTLILFNVLVNLETIDLLKQLGIQYQRQQFLQIVFLSSSLENQWFETTSGSNHNDVILNRLFYHQSRNDGEMQYFGHLSGNHRFIFTFYIIKLKRGPIIHIPYLLYQNAIRLSSFSHFFPLHSRPFLRIYQAEAPWRQILQI